MKKLLSVILTIIMLVMPVAQMAVFALPSEVAVSDSETEQADSTETATLAASSGTCGENLTWTLDDEGTLTISGTGVMGDWWFPSGTPWYNKTVKKVVLKSGVTTIGMSAFENITTLESVEIADTVSEIKTLAFDECVALKEIIIPDSVTVIGESAFQQCKNLEKVTLSNELQSIGNYAFWQCSKIESIIIPNTVSDIGDRVFYGCDNLTIYGYANSIAQTYAQENEVDFVTIIDPVSFSTSMQAYLNLEGLISMSVGYKFADMDSINPEDYLDSVGLLVWDAENAPEEAEATFENCDNVLEGARYNSVLGRFETTTEGIVAKKLGDQLCFRAYCLNEDGSYSYSKYITNYSPKTYCYNQITKNADDEVAVELMASILNYGAAAQKYFGYRTDDLMNADLPEELK